MNYIRWLRWSISRTCHGMFGSEFRCFYNDYGILRIWLFVWFIFSQIPCCRWIIFVGFVDLLAELVMVCLDQNSGIYQCINGPFEQNMHHHAPPLYHFCFRALLLSHLVLYQNVPDDQTINVGGLIISNARPWWAMQKGSSWHAMLLRSPTSSSTQVARLERSLNHWSETSEFLVLKIEIIVISYINPVLNTVICQLRGINWDDFLGPRSWKFTWHREIRTLSSGNWHSQPMFLTKTTASPDLEQTWVDQLWFQLDQRGNVLVTLGGGDHTLMQLLGWMGWPSDLPFGSCNMAIEDCHLYPFIVDFPNLKIVIYYIVM